MNAYSLFNNIYKDKVVLVTGHTGFKGSWLILWLHKLGAKVIGYSKDIPTNPSHYDLMNLDTKCTSIIGTINDVQKLSNVFDKYNPEIVFHLAAQTVVGYSYDHPIETFASNVMGTVNVFECARKSKSVRAIVNVTSDKCYQNDDANIAFDESSRMGGDDPYSCSKGAAELVTNCYRNSFFNTQNIYLGSARAGNVLAGGDWTADALIPELIRAAFSNKPMLIRSPNATRPWQFVLEPLSGYLLLGQKLLEEASDFADGWNFGPSDKSINVLEVLHLARKNWDKLNFEYDEDKKFYKEAKYLQLDCSKAHKKMKWRPVWHIDKTLRKTVEWYKAYHENNILKSEENLDEYIIDAFNKGLSWIELVKKN